MLFILIIWTIFLQFLNGATGCMESHSGASAAAPIGAGMIALMLGVRTCLTWRDVQHLIIITAVKVSLAVRVHQRLSTQVLGLIVTAVKVSLVR